MRRPLALLSLMLLAAGAGDGRAASKPAPVWQTQIVDADRTRLAGLWGAWTRGLAQAEAQGKAGELAGLGQLAVPDAALPGPLPGVGAYRCRTLTLGVRDGGQVTTGVPALTRSEPVPCAITGRGGTLWFEESAGPRRVGGRLFGDGDRMIFLGSEALAGETGLRRYGADGDRDQVGVLRAFGDRSWRLELPWPRWQSNLVVIEILPA